MENAQPENPYLSAPDEKGTGSIQVYAVLTMGFFWYTFVAFTYSQVYQLKQVEGDGGIIAFIFACALWLIAVAFLLLLTRKLIVRQKARQAATQQ